MRTWLDSAAKIAPVALAYAQRGAAQRTDQESVEQFLAKWKGVAASELSTAQSFALDLCRLIGVDAPHPDAEQRYMFERPITFVHGDGSTSSGRIDLYRRGAFVLEAKKLKAATHTKGFDDAMLRALCNRYERWQMHCGLKATCAGERSLSFACLLVDCQ